MSTVKDLTTATRAFAVTKSDTAAIAGPQTADNYPVALYVGGGGNVAVTCGEDAAVTFVGVPAGGYIFCSPRLVMSTNTTATSIVALYNNN